MKHNLRKIALLLPFLALSACQSPSRVAQIFVYDSTDTFIKSLRTDLSAKLNGYIAYNVNYAERKQTTQNQQTIDALNDSRGPWPFDPIRAVPPGYHFLR